VPPTEPGRVVAGRHRHTAAHLGVRGEWGGQPVGQFVLGTALEEQPGHPGQHRLEQVEVGVRLVVQAGPQHAAGRSDLRTGERHPEQVWGEHQRPVVLGVVEQVVVQLRHPHATVHPALLCLDGQSVAGQDRLFVPSPFGGGCEHGREPPDQQAILLGHPCG
jgi:hypothetical protein